MPARKKMIPQKDLKKLRDGFEEKAKKLGLLTDFLFATRWNEYNRLLGRLDDLSAILDAEGYHEIIPVGKDGSKKVTHHSYADYLKTDANAQKLASFLSLTIEKAEKTVLPGSRGAPLAGGDLID